MRVTASRYGGKRRSASAEEMSRAPASFATSATAGFEEAFAQMEEVAARLHLAGTTQVGRIDGERRERVGAGDDGVVGEDGAELHREGVERLLELVLGN